MATFTDITNMSSAELDDLLGMSDFDDAGEDATPHCAKELVRHELATEEAVKNGDSWADCPKGFDPDLWDDGMTRAREMAEDGDL